MRNCEEKDIIDYLENSDEVDELFENFIGFLTSAPLLEETSNSDQSGNRKNDENSRRKSANGTGASYDEIVLTCFRFFPTITLKEIERMTPWEYNLRTKAHLLKENDTERRVYAAAFANRLYLKRRKKDVIL